MRLFLRILLLFFATSPLFAQNCENAYFHQTAGTKVEMSIFNDKDKLTSVNQQEITAIKNTVSGFQALITSSTRNDKGKVLSENVQTNIVCENGTIKLDLQSMFINSEQLKSFKDMNVTVEGEGLTLPFDMKVGSKLSDAHTSIKMAMGALTLMTMTFDVTNREIVGFEKVSTTAGDFNCVKMTYNLNTKVMGKHNYKVTQWFAKGVGLIKSISANEKGEIQNRMEMTSFKKV